MPVPRSSLLLAKFVVAAAWSAAMAGVIFIFGLVMGLILRLPGGSLSVILHGSCVAAVTAGLTIAVVLPFALWASVGRGYLLPMGMAVLALIMSNLIMVLGWAEYFPWAVAMVYAQDASALTPISYGIVGLTGLAGMLATYLWWQYADQNR